MLSDFKKRQILHKTFRRNAFLVGIDVAVSVSSSLCLFQFPSGYTNFFWKICQNRLILVLSSNKCISYNVFFLNFRAQNDCFRMVSNCLYESCIDFSRVFFIFSVSYRFIFRTGFHVFSSFQFLMCLFFTSALKMLCFQYSICI